MRFPLANSIVLAAVAVVGLIGPISSKSVNAAELECNVLAGQLKSGDDFQVKLELQSQNLRIEFGEDFCSEPAKQWFARKFVLPVPAVRGNMLPQAALQAPQAEILVTVRKRISNGHDALPLPGQIMRKGPLPDLGFESTGREVMPLPIQRAEKRTATDEPAKIDSVVADQQASNAPTQTEATATPTPGKVTTTASGVRISTDPEGGSAKVTKYKANTESSARAVTPAESEGKSTAPSVGVVAPSPYDDEPEPTHTCDREITDYWKAGTHVVNGQKTNLRGVFTIDINNDGRIDNVGFKIGALGRIGNVLNYFPVSEGRLAAKFIPTLKLGSDDDIHRLCPGNITFSSMSSEERQKAISSAKRRQKELTAGAKTVKKEGTAEKVEAAEQKAEIDAELLAKENTKNFLFYTIIISSVFFLFGGFGLFFAIRRMNSEDNDDEEDLEDDDEYEEHASERS